MPHSCIIIDDEPLALDLLENYIAKTNQLALKGRFDNPVDAFDFMKENDVELIFLDIEMPDLTGLELAGTLGAGVKVIFTTAYREFAVDSYELDAVDYLLKPFSFQRFLAGVSRAFPMQRQDEIPGLASSQDPIHIKSDNKTFRIYPKDILYIESFKDYVKIHTADKSLISYQHISNMEKLLPEDGFLRIHRSFLIAIDKIEHFTSTAIVISGTELPIGRTFKETVAKKLS